MNNAEPIIQQILPFFVFGIIFFFLFRILKNRGMKGAFFNSKIIETVSSTDSSKSGKHKTSFSVHKLQARNTDEIKIGIGITLRHRGAFRYIPLTLSVDEAKDEVYLF